MICLMKTQWTLSTVILVCWVAAGAWPSACSADEEFFETRIRPVLIERCFECHGKERPKAGLRVDSREALITGGDSGPAIVPGKAQESRLIQSILRLDETTAMPPKTALPKQVMKDFVHWVNAGAPWPTYKPTQVRRAKKAEVVVAKPPEDPGYKSALQVWLKAEGQPWTDGQPVHLWEDASGRGHDVVATAGGRHRGTGVPPKFVAQSDLHGFPAVRFEPKSGLGGSSATAPRIEGDAPFTLIVVARVRNAPNLREGLIAGFGELSWMGNPGKAMGAVLGLRPPGNGRLAFVGGWGNDALATTPNTVAVLDGGPAILTLWHTSGPLASSSAIFVNGQSAGPLTGSQAIANFARRQDLGFFLGHAQPWLDGFAGDVAEVLLFDRALSEADRVSLESHLLAKYRIAKKNARKEEVIALADPAFHKKHWAFESIRDVAPPAATDRSGPHPIDRFVAKAWAEKKLAPVESADTRTLIKRLHYDLTGLPPSADALKNALTELTPWSDAAWERLIDRLLASPRYGERWGRYWLDVARYADTAGDNADYPIPEARLYRDYVIDAFNADKPYDQFVREQLAGDLLAGEGPREGYATRVAATGYLAQGRRYATGPYELWHLTLEDVIDTVGQSFLGLTLRCARCHEHKYDPVSQEEYYGLYGIFDSTRFPWAGGEEFQSMRAPRQHFVPLVPPKEAADVLAASSKRKLDPKQSEIERRRGGPESLPVAYAVREGVPRPAVFQIAGDPEKPGPVIARSVPTFLPNVPALEIPSHESGRRQLADWLTRPEHPLTARVMVNRIWQHHFGRGLVATPSNFGTRGEPPTHPELLDWLARSFVTNGWSVKKMHRLILTSRVWRLASAAHPGNEEIDPANALLWRHDRRRLDAEAIRDSMLFASGRLNLDRPGPHPFPPIETWTFTQHTQFKDIYASSHRSVYLMTPRLQRHPFLSLFDGPDTNTTTATRTAALTPAQMLYLMNSGDVRTEAEAFANRVLTMPAKGRLPFAYALAYQRSPSDAETRRADRFLADYAHQGGGERAAWTALCRSLLVSHEFFYVD